jgi:hypothetical protein
MLATLCLLLLAGLVLGQAPADKSSGQPPANPAGKDSPREGKPPSPAEGLAELLEKVLKANPDIRVAEAKLREAEAELSRTRLLVTQKVVAAQRAVEEAKAQVKAAEEEYERLGQMVKKGYATQGQLDTAKPKLQAIKARLAEAEAEVLYLQGKPHAAAGDKGGVRWDLQVGHILADSDRTVRVWDLATGQMLATVREAQPAIGASVADKIRKALDAPVTVEFKDKTLQDTLKALQELAPGVTFQVHIPPGTRVSTPVNLRVKDVPLGAVCQALEDLFLDEFDGNPPGLRFVVREYGILVAPGVYVPTGALSLHAFWKGEGRTDKSKPASAEPKR